MNSILSGLLVALSLYSAIPVPQVEWKKNTMKYAVAFMPVVGLVIAGLEALWLLLCGRLGVTQLLYACGAAAIPVFVTGGFHLDGFVDTCDALCSYGDQEKRLEILKDPHIGAFGVIWLVVLSVLRVGLYAQVWAAPARISLVLCGYLLARVLGGSMIVMVRPAKNSGLAHLFAENAEKRPVRIAFLLWFAILAVLTVFFGRISGLLLLLALTALRVLVQRQFMRIFGGMTGDLCGFTITLCELTALVFAAFGGLAVGV